MTAALHGLVDAMPEAEYHAHPALSSSGARKLLPPGCPARFRWERDNPPASKPTLDFGSAAHRIVLGAGAELVTIDADDWRTKAAKDERDAAHAAGRIPVLRDDRAVIEAMAESLRAHPVAGVLLHPERGRPEQSLFWTDAETGVSRRARLDWLPNPTNGRMVLADYKSTASAEPGAFAKSVTSFGYYMQADWYLDGARQLQLAEDFAFVLVAQEKTAPYLITIFELDAEALRIGRARNRLALEVFAECSATDTWPGYADDVVRLSLPGWLTREYEGLAHAL